MSRGTLVLMAAMVMMLLFYRPLHDTGATMLLYVCVFTRQKKVINVQYVNWTTITQTALLAYSQSSCNTPERRRRVGEGEECCVTISADCFYLRAKHLWTF